MADVIVNKIQLPNDDNLYNVQDSRVDVLISDAGEQNTIRTIANNELAKALIPENAQAALDTLTEIANWIQNHPDSYAAFVSQYNGHKHTVTHTPTGTVSQSTFTGTADSTAVTADNYKISVSKSDHTHSGSFTPAGGVSQPTFTGTAGSTEETTGIDSTSILTSVKTEGEKPRVISWGGLSGSVANKCLTISYTDGTFDEGSMPTFNSTTKTFASATHTHDYTPSGTVSKPTFTGTAGTVNVAKTATTNNVFVATDTHTHSYTPKGTVSKPTFTGTASSITVSVPDKQATGD